MASSYMRMQTYGTARAAEEIAVSTSAVPLTTIPAKTKFALISARNEDARFRVDGNDPTSTVGHPIAVDSFVEIYGEDLDNFRAISQSGTTSYLFVTYFK